MAGAMDRVRHAERVGIIIVGPADRIVGHPDRRLGLADDVDVMGQREKRESHRLADLCQRVTQIIGILCGRDRPGEFPDGRTGLHSTRTRPPGGISSYRDSRWSPFHAFTCSCDAVSSRRRTPIVDAFLTKAWIP